MYTLDTLIIAGVVSLAGGLILGFFIATRQSTSRQTQQQLEAHLNELKQEQQDYQQKVTTHFEETADLVNQLTNSYRDVHNHLAKGAQLLANDDASNTLKALPATEEDNISEAAEDNPLNPPLDYAPKSTPYDQGMLSESFGLEKNNAHETIAEEDTQR